MKEWVPRKRYRSEFRQGPDEDALIVSDELDLDVAGEFPELKVRDGNIQARKEEEVVEYKLEPFGKAADPVRMYFKEIESFPRLTREVEVEIVKRTESGNRDVLIVVLDCPIAVREVTNLGGARNPEE